MAEVKWIKIATDIFSDEKILLIESMPEADAIIVIWFKLLCMAGKQNNSGVFMINDRFAYTDEMLATIFRRNVNVVRLALTTFEQFGMIEIVNHTITIPNWEKHQQLDALEKSREATKNRVRRHREKQRLLAEGTSQNAIPEDCNVTETFGNADRIDKNRIDINNVVVNNARACACEGNDNNNDDYNPFGDAPDHPNLDTIEVYATNNTVNMQGKNMEYLHSYCDLLGEALVRYAIDQANKCCKTGVPTWQYVETILKGFIAQKIQTVEQAEAVEENRKGAQGARSSPQRPTAAQESDAFWSRVPSY